MDLLNIGCGPHFDPQWVNVDLISPDPSVIQHDLRRGLPFGDRSFDAVYHSHLLEHLTPADAESLLRECRRVLRPGGVLRVAIPDLEAIARHYLAALEAAEGESEVDLANLHWMRIELLDQIVRTRSGGLMLDYARDEKLCNRQFVESRIGLGLFASPIRKSRQRQPFSRLLQPNRLRRRLQKARQALALAAARVIGGAEGYRALKEGYFRRSGEVHQWMYDRVSMKRLLQSIGFTDFAVCGANESRIMSFSEYELDASDGRVRKPDSLFVEAIRAAVPSRSAVTSDSTADGPIRKSA